MECYVVRTELPVLLRVLCCAQDRDGRELRIAGPELLTRWQHASCQFVANRLPALLNSCLTWLYPPPRKLHQITRTDRPLMRDPVAALGASLTPRQVRIAPKRPDFTPARDTPLFCKVLCSYRCQSCPTYITKASTEHMQFTPPHRFVAASTTHVMLSDLFL